MSNLCGDAKGWIGNARENRERSKHGAASDRRQNLMSHLAKIKTIIVIQMSYFLLLNSLRKLIKIAVS